MLVSYSAKYFISNCDTNVCLWPSVTRGEYLSKNLLFFLASQSYLLLMNFYKYQLYQFTFIIHLRSGESPRTIYYVLEAMSFWKPVIGSPLVLQYKPKFISNKRWYFGPSFALSCFIFIYLFNQFLDWLKIEQNWYIICCVLLEFHQ
jgi:hypothetical protein